MLQPRVECWSVSNIFIGFKLKMSKEITIFISKGGRKNETISSEFDPEGKRKETRQNSSRLKISVFRVMLGRLSQDEF